MVGMQIKKFFFSFDNFVRLLGETHVTNHQMLLLLIMLINQVLLGVLN